MLTVTTNTIPFHTITEVFGVVSGETNTPMSSSGAARRDALYEMTKEARRLGANAVVGVTFMTTVLKATGTVDTCAYGTAVTAEIDE